MQENTDEAVDQFHVRLLQNARYCEFANVDMEIKAQIELGTNSKQLRRYAFRHPKITLCELLDYGRILETDEKDAHVIEKQVIPEKLHEMNALKQYTTVFNVDMLVPMSMAALPKERHVTSVKSQITLPNVAT